MSEKRTLGGSTGINFNRFCDCIIVQGVDTRKREEEKKGKQEEEYSSDNLHGAAADIVAGKENTHADGAVFHAVEDCGPQCHVRGGGGQPDEPQDGTQGDRRKKHYTPHIKQLHGVNILVFFNAPAFTHEQDEERNTDSIRHG